MSDLTYKGYVGTAELSPEDGVFHGKLAFLRDLVTYESESAPGLVTAFHEAVDEYLADCAAEDREPDKPFKGQFNVRIHPDLHRALAQMAAAEKVSFNEIVRLALEQCLAAGASKSRSAIGKPRAKPVERYRPAASSHKQGQRKHHP